MREVIIIGIILVPIAIVCDKVLRKKFNVNRKEDNMSKANKRAQFVILTISFFVYLILSIILIAKYEELNTMFLIVPFLLVISFFPCFHAMAI